MTYVVLHELLQVLLTGWTAQTWVQLEWNTSRHRGQGFPKHPVMPDTISKIAIDKGLSLPTCLRPDEIWVHIHRYLHVAEQESDLKRY